MNRMFSSRLFWPVVMLLVLFTINLVAFPGFFSLEVKNGHLFGSLVDIARNGAPTLIIAVGMTLVIATRGIDLSVGAVCAIAGAVACSIILGSPEPGSIGTVAVAVIAALLIALVLGLWNGFLVAVLGIQPIIATLILMTAGRGAAMLITEGQILTVNSPPFKVIGSGFVLGIPVSVVIAAVIFAAAALLTRRTALGLLIESVGINPEASRQAGVRSRGLLITVYTFSAFAAAIAGLILTSNQTAADANNTGLFIELDAILAVVIGGTSLAGGRYSLLGTLVGALVIQTLVTTVYTVGIPPIATMVFKAAVVTAVCLLQSPTTNATFGRWRRSLGRGRPGTRTAERASVS
ncbi:MULTISPECIES: ABC transporter permease [unclassified Cryobacterium]|uniref:ABC transporter permease n=2 Tax=Microbacteriaceae TaxID=85023 RepID=A0ABY2IQK4_9MICO|nr:MULTISPECIES: ABC transporter permease [unclassified Cryobacterium]MEB0002806.1 ABC transporter permease [Cryobacterium sp. RTC2.1]TFC20653.1 ABC transporter permease [Cryobacterium glucosi]MDY7558575.1 ABC transporter permease [Cryobacterium sp. 10C3]MEB0202996.1 ABC transporter permease [Cryobacterium sp. 5I3]MEB0287713.1 ABC transporter permease [Cryobacterium sp. 10S3]